MKGKKYHEIQQDFRTLNTGRCPNSVTIRKWVEKFQQTGSLVGGPYGRKEGNGKAINEANIQKVEEWIQQEPGLSARAISERLGVRYNSAWKILKKIKEKQTM